LLHPPLEQEKIQQRLLEMGVEMRPNTVLQSISNGNAILSSSLHSQNKQQTFAAVVIVAGRRANNGLWHELQASEEQWADAGVQSIKRIGDCEAPAPIAWATYAGHRMNHPGEIKRELIEGRPALIVVDIQAETFEDRTDEAIPTMPNYPKSIRYCWLAG